MECACQNQLRPSTIDNSNQIPRLVEKVYKQDIQIGQQNFFDFGGLLPKCECGNGWSKRSSEAKK